MKKYPALVNQSREFGITEKFFSITDENGVILCGNDVFMRVSEYKSDEIIGKPHNIIRHPDMPRCVFDLFWKYIKSEKVIGAYVKNLAKDGLYYWVYALVSPYGDQFVSIRIKPSSDILSVVEGLYKELVQHENTYVGSRKDAMESSGVLLNNRLNDLGYAGYDEFMRVSLRTEITLHNNAIKNSEQAFKTNGNKHKSSNIVRLVKVFSNLEQLTKSSIAIKEKQSCFLSLEKELHSISTNTKFRASRLGEKGVTLGVISEEISRARADICIEIKRLTDDINAISNAINGLTLHSSLGLLQVQMQQSFSEEVEKSNANKSEQVARYGMTLSEINKTLELSSETSLDGFIKEMNMLSFSINEFKEFILFLSRMIQILDFSYVTGQSLSASIENADDFREILTGLKLVANRSSKDLRELKTLVDDVSIMVE